MGDLVVVLQGVLEVHFGRGVLMLAVFQVANCGLAAGTTESAAQLGKFGSSCCEEGFDFRVIAFDEEGAGLDPEEVGKYQIFVLLVGNEDAVVEKGLY